MELDRNSNTDNEIKNPFARIDALAENDKSYPALDFIAGLFKFFGWLLVIAGIIGLVVFISKEMVLVGILILIASSFNALISFAFAELITVFTDISSSTYRIRKHLQYNK
ncbi:MAG: hypothetical protein QM233_02735 [Candidatus Cloacimonadota bacterium]|jgi:hypothetical protein|nr:hypothetical protein [Candidatus Cloacimonadota bacterium]